jgi:hypothetical protein
MYAVDIFGYICPHFRHCDDCRNSNLVIIDRAIENYVHYDCSTLSVKTEWTNRAERAERAESIEKIRNRLFSTVKARHAIDIVARDTLHGKSNLAEC